MLRRQEQEIDALAVHQLWQRVFQRAPCSALAGGIAIETEHHLVGQAQQFLYVIRRGRRAQRGDSILNPMLSQRHHIHVAFHNQRLAAGPDGFLRLEQTVQFAPLLEQRRFRRVQVFGLALVQHAPAEADDLPALVDDRKHDAVAEAIITFAASSSLSR